VRQVTERKSVNFTILAAEDDTKPRLYSNFCAVQLSPFDITLTFCEMQPLGEKQLREAEQTQVVHAPVRVRLAIPPAMVPGLVTALQENFERYQEAFGPPKGPLH
jgi:hypothetical protein